jgi:hypothetical protein
MSRFTDGQLKFINKLAAETRLDRRVVGAWVLAEENGSAAQVRERQKNFNWLNIGYFDSGAGKLTKDKTWASPEAAAEATADFLKGRRFGASSGIQKILSSAGQGASAQVDAIAQSGWASSGYNGGANIRANLDATGLKPAASESPTAPSLAIETPDVKTTFDQAGYDKARRRAIVGNLIAKRDPNSLLIRTGVLQPGELPHQSDFRTTKVGTKTETVKPTVTLPQVTRESAGGVVTATQFIARANAIDAKRLPYQWGGGHSGKVDPKHPVPLDCSGAVSAVLNIDPRVSGDFERWGKPGEGGVATVYANPKHVLMKIRGRDGQWHFFGTSASNPRGGAGWIPAEKITSDYLKNFTARHV